MDEIFAKRLEKRLDPDTVTENLSRVGVAITLYELLKYQVIDQVKWFTGFGMDMFENDGITRKSGFRDCLEWLERTGAISREDTRAIEEVRAYRNQLAHEGGSFVVDPDVEIRDEVIDEGAAALRALALFWARIDVDINEAYDGMDIRDEDIGLPPVVSLFEHVLESTRPKT